MGDAHDKLFKKAEAVWTPLTKEEHAHLYPWDSLGALCPGWSSHGPAWLSLWGNGVNLS